MSEVDVLELDQLDAVVAPCAEGVVSASDAAGSSSEDVTEAVGDALLVLALEGFEGPIDLLLHLARDQKLDLTKISILRLAEQYLAFIEQARELRLEIAADYLVMAAWLAYLKSRLLLPKQEREGDEEPTGEELAAALAWQMQRLEAMQKAAEELVALPQKGIHTFARGSQDGALETVVHREPVATIYDLLSAYAAIKKRTMKPEPLKFVPFDLASIDEAIIRLRSIVGTLPEWTTLGTFLPKGLKRGVVGRSHIAATFIASLELAKQGLLEVRQEANFQPIYIRRAGGACSESADSSFSVADRHVQIEEAVE